MFHLIGLKTHNPSNPVSLAASKIYRRNITLFAEGPLLGGGPSAVILGYRCVWGTSGAEGPGQKRGPSANGTGTFRKTAE